jgi:hypothetical protein
VTRRPADRAAQVFEPAVSPVFQLAGSSGGRRAGRHGTLEDLAERNSERAFAKKGLGFFRVLPRR